MNRPQNVSHWMKQMMLTEFYFRKMICGSKKWENCNIWFCNTQHITYHNNIILWLRYRNNIILWGFWRFPPLHLTDIGQCDHWQWDWRLLSCLSMSVSIKENQQFSQKQRNPWKLCTHRWGRWFLQLVTQMSSSPAKHTNCHSQVKVFSTFVEFRIGVCNTTTLDCEQLECVHDPPLKRDHSVCCGSGLRHTTLFFPQPNHTVCYSAQFRASHRYTQTN